MNTVFLQILNMSLTASYVILFVLTTRLLLKKAPKIFSYALWGVVLFRLVCPFSFEGLFSLLIVNPEPIPSNIAYAEVPQINTGIELVDSAVNPILSAQTAAQGASVNPMQICISIGKWVWFAGIAVLLIYSAISLLRLRSRLVGTVKWYDNIYLADHITSPFVMGFLRPKIYLPSTLSEREREYIILHEQTHIQRFDHIVKIVAFLVLSVHWFNPLVWLAFFLCIKDMEMSCDESVMKRMDTDVRREYSASLLSLATGRKIVAGTPLAFGEGDTKGRIKNVMNYKKPAFWIVAAAVVVCIVLAVCLIGNPPDTSGEISELFSYSISDIEKIEFQNGNTGELVSYTGETEMNDIIEHLNAFKYDRIEPVVSSGWTYAVRLWFKNGSDMQRITLTPSRASIDGNHYISSEHEYFPQEWLEEYCLIQEDALTPEGIVHAFFQAFGDADYESMKPYCTQECIDTIFNADDVMGMKWAKALNIEASSADVTEQDNETAVFVSIEMEILSTAHALYGSDQTSFFVILSQGEQGAWLIDRFVTG